MFQLLKSWGQLVANNLSVAPISSPIRVESSSGEQVLLSSYSPKQSSGVSAGEEAKLQPPLFKLSVRHASKMQTPTGANHWGTEVVPVNGAGPAIEVPVCPIPRARDCPGGP